RARAGPRTPRAPRRAQSVTATRSRHRRRHRHDREEIEGGHHAPASPPARRRAAHVRYGTALAAAARLGVWMFAKNPRTWRDPRRSRSSHPAFAAATQRPRRGAGQRQQEGQQNWASARSSMLLRSGGRDPFVENAAARSLARTFANFPTIRGPGRNLMQPILRPGASRTNRIVVGRERTIAFLGEEARTYATPSMILDIEHTCRELILEHASAGEDSVGMEVAVKHLAPTLMGMTVEITTRITSVEGRKVSFEVTVKDELDTVGTGSHMRFVVEKAKTLERLKAKAARVATLKGAAAPGSNGW